MMFILHVYNIDIIVLGDNYLCTIYKINTLHCTCCFIRLYIFFVTLIIQGQVLKMQYDQIDTILIAGNICRSPISEALFLDLLEKKGERDSVSLTSTHNTIFL